MPSGPHRVFASRGIARPGLLVTIVTIVAAFAIGIAAGWGTTLFADRYNASPTPSPSPSASPSPSITPTYDVSVPPLEPVTREIDAEDKAAGLRTLDFPYKADGTFTPVPAGAAGTADTDIVAFVRIDVEDGLQMIDGTLAMFVMSALNDPQGWGVEGPTTFVQTEGVPDVRVVFASPYTAAALCPDPHQAAVLTPTESPSPSPSPSLSDAGMTVQCAQESTIVVSVYDWIQGLKPFKDDRTSARVYFLNHGLGHVLGKPDVSCKKGVADVMVNQVKLAKACKPNPWPFPDKS